MGVILLIISIFLFFVSSVVHITNSTLKAAGWNFLNFLMKILSFILFVVSIVFLVLGI